MLFSCKGGDEFTDKERASVTKEVRETLFKIDTEVKEKGLLAELKYLDSTQDFFWAPPGFWYNISYDSVVRIMRINASTITSVNNNWDTLKIIPISAKYATYTGRIHSITTTTTGKTVAMSLMETGLMVKRKDGWRIQSGQTSVLQQ